jgi:hypothetical protein
MCFLVDLLFMSLLGVPRSECADIFDLLFFPCFVVFVHGGMLVLFVAPWI